MSSQSLIREMIMTNIKETNHILLCFIQYHKQFGNANILTTQNICKNCFSQDINNNQKQKYESIRGYMEIKEQDFKSFIDNSTNWCDKCKIEPLFYPK